MQEKREYRDIEQWVTQKCACFTGIGSHAKNDGREQGMVSVMCMSDVMKLICIAGNRAVI